MVQARENTQLMSASEIDRTLVRLAHEILERSADLDRLAFVGIEERAGTRPPQLSGGERQRIAIARALANRPPLVLADEPTGRLDSTTSAKVMDLLENLQREEGITLVVVTHDPEVASRAGRIVRMLDGRVVESLVSTV